MTDGLTRFLGNPTTETITYYTVKYSNYGNPYSLVNVFVEIKFFELNHITINKER